MLIGIRKLTHQLLCFSLLFPFVPQIIAKSDTQPWFIIISFFYAAFIFVDRNFEHRHVKISKSNLIFIVIITSLITINISNYYLKSGNFLLTRQLSFLQLIIAIYWSKSLKIDQYLTKSIKIYFLFTLIYILSGGVVEDILITSRDENFAILSSSGRGIRTLSPEPSFLALQILNIVVIGFLTNSKTVSRGINFYGLVILSFITLSGFGFLISGFLLLIKSRKNAILITSIPLVLLWASVSFLNFNSTRVFYLINLFLDKGLDALIQDPSISTRLNSANIYYNSFIDLFPLGDGMNIFQGGGFISLISGLGLIGLIIFIWIIIKILVSKITFKTKILLYFWIFINFWSGPMGIPAIGYIIGLILTKDNASFSINGRTQRRRVY